jgi:hypothetical protein
MTQGALHNAERCMDYGHEDGKTSGELWGNLDVFDRSWHHIKLELLSWKENCGPRSSQNGMTRRIDQLHIHSPSKKKKRKKQMFTALPQCTRPSFPLTSSALGTRIWCEAETARIHKTREKWVEKKKEIESLTFLQLDEKLIKFCLNSQQNQTKASRTWKMKFKATPATAGV